MFLSDSVNPNLKSTIISFLSPANFEVEDGTGAKIFSNKILEIIKSFFWIVIPRITTSGVKALKLVFSGLQFTKISANVDSPILES